MLKSVSFINSGGFYGVKLNNLNSLVLKSIQLLNRSSLYNSLIQSICNYQSEFNLKTQTPYEFFENGNRIFSSQFFRRIRRDKLIFGIALAEKVNDNSFQIVSPHKLDFKNLFSIQNDEIFLTFLDGSKRPISEFVIFVNSIFSDSLIIAPEMYYVFDEIEQFEKLQNSLEQKIITLSNLVGIYKLTDPTLLENLGEGAISTVQETFATVKIRPASIVSTEPGTQFDVVTENNALPSYDYVISMLTRICAAVGVPSFLVSGDFERINYAAARSALQDFINNSQQQIKVMVNDFLSQLNEQDYQLVFPFPISVSIADQMSLAKLLLDNELVDKSIVVEKLKLSGLI